MQALFALMLAVAVAGAQSDTVYKPGDGVSLPQVTKQVGPQYTSEAMAHRIEGVVVDCDADGRATAIELLRVAL